MLDINVNYTNIDIDKIYSIKITTPSGDITMSTSNNILRTVYFYSYRTSEIFISADPYLDYRPCLSYNKEEHVLYYQDYSNVNKDYLRLYKAVDVGIIIQSQFTSMTKLEKDYFYSIKRSLYGLNRENGIRNTYLHVNQYHYKDLLQNFALEPSNVYFGIFDYKILSDFEPLLSITNKYLIYLLPHPGEICENNIILVNYIPYTFSYFISSYILLHTDTITLIYDIGSSYFSEFIYKQLYKYPYNNIIKLSFDVNTLSSYNSISDYLEEYNGKIILIVGSIDLSHDFSSKFLTLFDENKHYVITDITPSQMAEEDRKYVNGFKLFGSYYQTYTEKEMENSSDGYLKIISSYITWFKKESSEHFAFNPPRFLGIVSVKLLSSLYQYSEDLKITSNILNRVINIGLSDYHKLLPSRMMEQPYYIVKYSYTDKSNFELIFTLKSLIIPYSYSSITPPAYFCSFDESSSAYEKHILSLLFIISYDSLEESVRVFLTLNYAISQKNSYHLFHYFLQPKIYYSTNELKEIVESNLDNYYFYITDMSISHLKEIRYLLNNKILFYISYYYPQEMLQSNIIPLSSYDSTIVNIISQEFRNLNINAFSVISYDKMLYLFFK